MNRREVAVFRKINQDRNPGELEMGEYLDAENIEIYDAVDGYAAAVQGVPGTREITYALPSGTNKSVGKYFDKNEASVYYFIWNSNGDHSVLRYSQPEDRVRKVLQSSLLSFSENYKISGITKVDNYLYWSEPNNPQRKINVAKADDTDKASEIRFYIYNFTGPSLASYPSFTVQLDFTGSLVGATSTYTPTGAQLTDYRELVKGLADQFNVDFAGLATATFDGTYVTLRPTAIETVNVVNILKAASPTTELAYRKWNQYDYPITESVITLGKNPPHCHPDAQYGSTGDRDVNYLKDKLFQFRYRFIYDDWEKSAWSPISYVPLPDAVPVPYPNMINVILDDTGDQCVIGIEVAFRTSNTDEFKLAKTIELENFIVYPDTSSSPIYGFKNDGAYQVIDQVDSDKLYDAIPVRSNSMAFFKGRNFLAGNVNGYDQIPIDAQLNLDFGPPVVGGDFATISGRIKVNNPAATGYYADNVPVWKSKFGYAYGGATSAALYPGYALSDPLYANADVANQSCPLGGFTVYLAGTNFYAITKLRVSINGTLQSDAESWFGNPIYNYWRIWHLFHGRYYAGIGNLAGGPAPTVPVTASGITLDIYHEFNIYGVPLDRTFSVRVASNLIDLSKFDSDLTYQKTSARIMSWNGAMDVFEQEVSTSVPGVIDITPGSAIVIGDMFHDAPGAYIRGVEGYFTDSDGNSFNGARMDAYTSSVGVVYESRRCDHNGYGWAAYIDPAPTAIVASGGVGIVVSEVAKAYIGSASNVLNSGAFIDAYINGNASTWYGSLYTAESYMGWLTNSGGGVFDYDWRFEESVPNTTTLRGLASRLFHGKVFTSSGITMTGVWAIASGAQFIQTDSGGEFELRIYQPDSTGSADITLYFHNPATPYGTFSPATFVESGYTWAADVDVYLTTAIIFTPALAPPAQTKFLKRGGEYNYGIVYYDDLNRSTTVLFNDFLNVKVPFWTENFETEFPILSWEINHQPPVWATHYQWVRTKNLKIQKYIQFGADVESPTGPYGGARQVNLFRGTYSSGLPVFDGTIYNSTELWINFNDLLLYDTKYTGSLLAYDFSIGDRIRFIYKPGTIFFGQYIDVEVKGFNNGFIVIEYDSDVYNAIKDGCTFELYTPLLSAQDQIFYEIGECYEILDAGTSTRRHAGGFAGSDQVVGVSPATGTFYTGDTYDRYRTIFLNNGSSYVLRIEDQSYSDFYVSQIEDIGRPNVYSRISRQVYDYSQVIWSQLYIPGTLINGLSTYEANDNKTLSISEGPICHIESVGTVLMAWQKIRTATCFVNEKIVKDTSGSSLIAASTEVLSEFQYLAGMYGCSHGATVFVNNNYAYWFDAVHGCVCRYGPDGVTEVSSYGKDGYFRRLSFDIADAPLVIAHGFFNYRTQSYYLVVEYDVVDLSGSEDGTVPAGTINRVSTHNMYSEKVNGWICSHTWIPDVGCPVNGKLTAVKDGVFYVFDGSLFNFIFEQIEPKSITAVFNYDSKKMRKIFLDHSVQSNNIWVLSQCLTPNGQETNNVESDYERRENTWYAPFMRDANTPVSNPIIEGDVIRDYWAKCKFVNADTSFARLESIRVGYAISSVLDH